MGGGRGAWRPAGRGGRGRPREPAARRGSTCVQGPTREEKADREKYFPLFGADELIKEESWEAAKLSSKDAISIRIHRENHKRGIVRLTGLRKARSGWRSNQRKLLSIRDVSGLLRRVIQCASRPRSMTLSY